MADFLQQRGDSAGGKWTTMQGYRFVTGGTRFGVVLCLLPDGAAQPLETDPLDAGTLDGDNTVSTDGQRIDGTTDLVVFDDTAWGAVVAACLDAGVSADLLDGGRSYAALVGSRVKVADVCLDV